MTTDIEEKLGYEKLLHSFKERKVILFIGAGSSRTVGLPHWRELLDKMRGRFNYQDSKSKLTERQKATIECLFQCQIFEPHKTQEYYSKVAEIFQQCDPNLYREVMRENFEGDILANVSECHSYQEYLESISRLPVRGIITTNYDKILEQKTAFKNWKSFTWQDVNNWNRIEDFRIENFIFHLHGRIDQPDSIIHTSTEYQNLYGSLENMNKKVRTFSNLSFTLNTVLFIGYRLGDPIIQQIKKFTKDYLGVIPLWYQLVPKHEEESAENREQDDPIQLAYPIKFNLYPRRTDYATALSKWLKKLKTDIIQYGVTLNIAIMTHNTNSIAFYGVTKYLETSKSNYEVFDFKPTSSLQVWIEEQVVSSTAFIIIYDVTVKKKRLHEWVTLITNCCNLKHKSLNILIYNTELSADIQYNIGLGIKIACSPAELETFINSVASNVSESK